MKTRFILIILMSIFGTVAFAQDVIYKNDQTQVKSKIIEVLTDEIKYKKFDFIDGPIYSMPKAEIYMIIYKNGQTEMFAKQVSDVKRDAAQQSGVSTEPAAVSEPSKFSIPRKSCNMIDFGVNLQNFSDYSVPSLVMTTDMVLWNNAAIGAHIGYYSTNISQSYGFYDTTITSYTLSIGVRGNYYLNGLLKIDPDKFQLYAGLTAIFAMTTVSSVSNDPFAPYVGGSLNEIKPMVQTGIRYFFSDRIGLNAEVEYLDEINAKLGLSIRILRK